MTDPEAALAELADEFELLDDWQAQIQHVIDLGRALPPLTDAERSAENKVAGCASQVWLVLEPQAGALRFRGDSDSALVKGLIAVLERLYNGADPRAVLAFDLNAALARLGLAGHLTPQRSNGLASMDKRLRQASAILAQAPA